MINDLDIEIEFEEEVKFIFDHYTIYYNRTHKEWYAECDDSNFYEFVDRFKFIDSNTVVLFGKYDFTVEQFAELQLLI